MDDRKRWMDWLFGLLGTALVLGPLVACLGCTEANREARGQGGPLSALLNAPRPEDAGELADLGEADAGELLPNAGPDAAAPFDAGEQGEAMLPLSDLHCEPFGGYFMPWMVSECGGLSEGAACDSRGQWDGDARCVRFGIDFCQDNPRTTPDECFGCAACQPRN